MVFGTRELRGGVEVVDLLLPVVLFRVVVLGVWRVETHGKTERLAWLHRVQKGNGPFPLDVREVGIPRPTG